MFVYKTVTDAQIFKTGCQLSMKIPISMCICVCQCQNWRTVMSSPCVQDSHPGLQLLPGPHRDIRLLQKPGRQDRPLDSRRTSVSTLKFINSRHI